MWHLWHKEQNPVVFDTRGQAKGKSRKNKPFVIDAHSPVKAIKPKHALCRGSFCNAPPGPLCKALFLR